MKKVVLLILFTSAFILSGCSKLNRYNYDQIAVGMDKQDVIMLLGNPAKCADKDGTETCIWGKADETFIRVKFIGQNAVYFEQHGL